ncbi:MAG: hypothetical protein D6798_18920 [Deltaproteobacteria bacterium]|nr:MAG: hypothetical protein D6798_18920 [Deltaproteobacteria bacterium]
MPIGLLLPAAWLLLGGCREEAPGDLVEQVISLVDERARQSDLRFGMARNVLPEGIKGPAGDDVALPEERDLADVACAELSGAGLSMIPSRFDHTSVCFYRDEVYVRGATMDRTGNTARSECSALIEGIAHDFGLDNLPLSLAECPRTAEGTLRSAHCERKERVVEGDDRIGYAVQVDRFGPPSVRSEMVETIRVRGREVWLDVRSVRVEPEAGEVRCRLDVLVSDPERRAAALAAASSSTPGGNEGAGGAPGSPQRASEPGGGPGGEEASAGGESGAG